MSVKPISPDEVASKKKEIIPEAVFEAFNELIAEDYSGGYAEVKQEEVVNRLVEKNGLDRAEIFNKGWLNVEEVYREAGWKVVYDKPGWDENYSAFFKFSRR